MNTIAYQTKSNFYGWKNVLFLFLVSLFAGGFGLGGFSVIFPAMIKAMDWNRGTASIAPALNWLLMGLFFPLVALSINKLGSKKTIIIGIIILFIGVVLLGTVMSQIWHWIIIYGVITSLGFNFSGILHVQTTLMHWFSIKRATALGIVMAGGSLGGFLAQPFYTWIIWVTGDWQYGWLIGSAFVLIAFICSLFVISKPSDVNQYPDGVNPNEMDESQIGPKTNKTHKTSVSWQLKEVLKTPVVWLLTLVALGYIMPLIFITTHGVLHFTDIGFSQMQAAFILSSVILGGGIVRLPIGWLGDQIEPRRIIMIAVGMMLLMFIGLWQSSHFSLLIAAGIIFGLSYGAMFVIHPTIMANYFGPDAYAGISAAIAPFTIIFVACVPTVSGYIFEKTSSYDWAFIILSIIVTLALIASFFLLPPSKK